VVLPDDEPFEYLVTQAVADYLAGENDPVLDGIIYPSVQATEGKNVVLFHPSARVEQWSIPKGTRMSVRLYAESDDGDVLDCSVVEETPPEQPPVPADPTNSNPLWPSLSDLAACDPLDEPLEYDSRLAALRLDAASVMVHVVNAVRFTTEEHPVHRHRFALNGTTPF
jgi:hypothetical protein